MNPNAARAPLDAYLSELATLLRGPRRRRDQILAELRDGLDHAVDDRVARGLTEARAAAEAVAEFGPPRVVAGAFAGELATAYARRTMAAYIATGPLVGIWWLLLAQLHPWRTGLIALLVAIPVLPLVFLATAAAVTTLATTGRLIRWLPEVGPRRALGATMALASLVLAADTTLIAIHLWSDVPVRPLAVLAITASLVRIGCGTAALRRAGAMRRATKLLVPAAGAPRTPEPSTRKRRDA